MRLLLLLLLTAVSVWGFPEQRVDKRLPQHQEKKELRVRESPRDCKGKCATNIAQKAAAEAKAAHAAQNAAGAQAAHMVSLLIELNICNYKDTIDTVKSIFKKLYLTEAL